MSNHGHYEARLMYDSYFTFPHQIHVNRYRTRDAIREIRHCFKQIKLDISHVTINITQLNND